MEKQMLSEKEIYQHIPQSFTICNNPIEVIIRDEITIPIDMDEVDVRYGQWNEVALTIELARSVRVDDNPIPLTLEQIQSTFTHELMHCFEFFSSIPYDEQKVQLFANWFREFEISKKFKK